jgi:hypothetical protein
MQEGFSYKLSALIRLLVSSLRNLLTVGGVREKTRGLIKIITAGDIGNGIPVLYVAAINGKYFTVWHSERRRIGRAGAFAVFSYRKVGTAAKRKAAARAALQAGSLSS